MNTKLIVAATTLIVASSISAPAFAQESEVQQILTNMVKQAVNAASNEIEVQIDKVIISSGNILSLESEVSKGKVVITDIASKNTSKEAEQNSESSNE
jgi:hypothetical protein